MRKSDITKQVHLKFPELSLEDTELCINHILDGIAKTIAFKNRVEIRGFGIFYAVERPTMIRRNPRTSTNFLSESRIIPRFKASKQILNIEKSDSLNLAQTSEFKNAA